MDPVKKILIVDDDQYLRDIYSELLSSGNYVVDTAQDGEEGFSKISQNSYDLILLDIMMPKLDGISVLKKLNQTNALSKVAPIVMLSALDQSYIVDSALSFGAKGFLSKSSLDPDQVLKSISDFIAKNPRL